MAAAPPRTRPRGACGAQNVFSKKLLSTHYNYVNLQFYTSAAALAFQLPVRIGGVAPPLAPCPSPLAPAHFLLRADPALLAAAIARFTAR